MHIAYSALPNINQPMPVDKITVHTEHSIRLEAYQDTCDKFCKEIIAIQKYIPGWVPAYPVL
jgi:hypothetical protein